ncbi:15553_t:CDS:2, partial [Entrophospora sp. SA101]
FKKGHELVGMNTKLDEELEAEFDKIDTKHGGYILFEEYGIK